MTRSPTGPQFAALQRAFACQGETWATDIPRTVLGDCVKAGWLFEDSNGHVFMTDFGRKTFEARR